jgi:hypothetical protein
VGGKGCGLWVEAAQADLIPESIKKFDKQEGGMPDSCSMGNKSCPVFQPDLFKNKNGNNFLRSISIWTENNQLLANLFFKHFGLCKNTMFCKVGCIQCTVQYLKMPQV